MVNKSKIWMKTFTNAFVSLYNERRIQIQLRTVSCKMNPAFTARHPLTLYHLANSSPKKKDPIVPSLTFFLWTCRRSKSIWISMTWIWSKLLWSDCRTVVGSLFFFPYHLCFLSCLQPFMGSKNYGLEITMVTGPQLHM